MQRYLDFYREIYLSSFSKEASKCVTDINSLLMCSVWAVLSSALGGRGSVGNWGGCAVPSSQPLGPKHTNIVGIRSPCLLKRLGGGCPGVTVASGTCTQGTERAEIDACQTTRGYRIYRVHLQPSYSPSSSQRVFFPPPYSGIYQA